MSDLAEVKRLIVAQGDAWEEFKANHVARLDELEKRFGRLALTGLALTGKPAGTALNAADTNFLNAAAIALLAGDVKKAYAHFAEVKAMSVGSDPDGGYVVLPQFSAAMTRISGEVSPMTRLARTITIDRGDSWEEIVDKDQAAASWVAETASRPDTAQPELRKTTIMLHEIYSQPKATQRLLDAATLDVWGWLQEKVAEAFAVKESAAFHTGNGVGQPTGFLSHTIVSTDDATRAWNQLQYIPTGAAGAFQTPSASVNPADCLVDAVGKLKAQYRAGATWIMSRTTAAVVRKLKDAQGRHVWTDKLTEGVPDMLLGFPVEMSEDMPAIAANSHSIALGNWRKGYAIVRFNGVKFLADPYTDKPNVRLYSYAKTGGHVMNFEAIKLVKFSAS